MAMTTKTKLVVVLLGSLSGALITAAFSAFIWWIVTYTDSGSGFLGPNSAWAPVAALVGGVIGFLMGALLGLVLSLMRRKSLLFGTLAGTIEGLAINLLLLGPKGLTTGDMRGDLMFAAFVPIGAISGLLTPLVISAITSWANRRDDSYVVLDLQQNKANESRLTPP
jgi:hypothetical protein